MKIRNTLLVAAVIAGSALLAPFYGPGIQARAATTGDDLPESMKAVMNAYSLVEQNFADPVSPERAIYQGAIPGMLHTLDPHSNFLDPTEYADMQRKQRAQYFGVGMEITMDQSKVVVNQPFVGSPAWNAGLRRGDVIASVGGHNTIGIDSPAVADMLRGPRGTQVHITVLREGSTTPVAFDVTRGEIETSLVDAFWVQPGIAYLSVTGFDAQNVSKDVEADLQKLGESTVTGLILDLRGNLGGLVNEAVALAGRFLHTGQVVVSHHGRAEAEQVFRAKGQTAAQKYPIVVLVDRQSASASEIVSGALQDHDRAWVMGETTFGKGLVQAQFPLAEGAALLLTIAHYYTPSGRLIQRDYSHQSFFDYYFAKRSENQNTDDVKATDSGRKVYGGGGITPDEKYPSPTYNPFQRHVMVSCGPPVGQGVPPGTGCFRFGNFYFGAKKPELSQGWQPDTNAMDRFKEFLQNQKVNFTDSEFAANQDWVKGVIRYELYFRAFDKKTADRARWEHDPEVRAAVQSLPKAEALLKDAQKILAQRAAVQ